HSTHTHTPTFVSIKQIILKSRHISSASIKCFHMKGELSTHTHTHTHTHLSLHASWPHTHTHTHTHPTLCVLKNSRSSSLVARLARPGRYFSTQYPFLKLFLQL